MIFRYSALGEGQPRPFLEVTVGDADFRVKALLDTGAVHTLFPAWVARIAQIDLLGGITRPVSFGGQVLETTFVVVRIEAADLSWEAEAGFCHGWTSGWGLLGQESFFRFFTVTFKAADRVFEIKSNPD